MGLEEAPGGVHTAGMGEGVVVGEACLVQEVQVVLQSLPIITAQAAAGVVQMEDRVVQEDLTRMGTARPFNLPQGVDRALALAGQEVWVGPGTVHMLPAMDKMGNQGPTILPIHL